MVVGVKAPATCSVEDCGRHASYRGWCQMHYMRWYRRGGGGPPEASQTAPVPDGSTAPRTDGYIRIKVGPSDWQLEHRVVAERMIGRPIRDDENVHHINGIRSDNRPENLMVLDAADHQRLHEWHLRTNRAAKTCERCAVMYMVKRSREATSRFCSNGCRLAALHEGNRKE